MITLKNATLTWTKTSTARSSEWEMLSATHGKTSLNWQTRSVSLRVFPHRVRSSATGLLWHARAPNKGAIRVHAAERPWSRSAHKPLTNISGWSDWNQDWMGLWFGQVGWGVQALILVHATWCHVPEDRRLTWLQFQVNCVWSAHSNALLQPKIYGQHSTTVGTDCMNPYIQKCISHYKTHS